MHNVCYEDIYVHVYLYVYKQKCVHQPTINIRDNQHLRLREIRLQEETKRKDDNHDGYVLTVTRLLLRHMYMYMHVS